MGKISFIHLSDIHFRKSSGNIADIDNDLREAIITDIETNAKTVLTDVEGILVTGDIAFSGRIDEYENAKKFLKQITDIFSIKQSAVFCVPGNHDVDQSVPKASPAVYAAQCKLAEARSLDEADRIFECQIIDCCYNDILFQTFQNYNSFASMFDCNIDVSRINWSHRFELDHGMKLRLYGMNSSFISNSDDNNEGENKPMYIGQAQIPSRREKDTVIMSLCHHPPEIWKFCGDIQDKINRRIDIQLYGHKHIQSIKINENNVIMSSGATHPVRGKDWNPRYNWVTIECIIIDNKRAIRIEIYPRILNSSRDRFIPDTVACNSGNCVKHILEIDKKRSKDLFDEELMKVEELYEQKTSIETNEPAFEAEIDIRELKYNFFSLSYIRQTKILLDLNLLEDFDKGKKYSSIMNKIINKARQTNQINALWSSINS
jgi:calcineurin-like phosphoesterase family protein